MDLGIDGAYVRGLRVVRNAKGTVRECLRADDGDFPGFGQVHVVETLPGIIRAWFRHRLQFDQLNCIHGIARIGLYDDRPGSLTCGAFADITLSAGEPRVVGIPPQVWHGIATIGDQPSVLLQHNSQAFNHAEPDEEKRPFDAPGFPIVW